MSRKPRRIQAGRPYHLISRFVARDWFIQSESDRRNYLELLGSVLRKTDWRCLSYAIMSNHIHLAMVAGCEPLASWLRRVHGPFADGLNKTRDRIGAVFVRGPRSLLVPRRRVADVIAYIHNNPVRAGVVHDATESKWTSHRAYSGLDPAPAWLCVNEGLELAGVSDRSTFSSFVTLWLAERRGSDAPDEADLDAEIETLSWESDDERLTRPPVTPDSILEATASTVGADIVSICSTRRQRELVFARRVAARCARQLGVSGTALANALGMSQQGVAFLQSGANDRDVETTAKIVLAALGSRA